MLRIAPRGLNLAPEWPPTLVRSVRISCASAGSTPAAQAASSIEKVRVRMPATLRPGRSSSRPLVMYVGRPKAAAPAQPWRPPAPGPERRRGHANPAPVIADPATAVPAARPASYAALRAPARAVPGTANVDATEHPVPTRVPRPWRGDHGSVRAYGTTQGQLSTSRAYRQGRQTCIRLHTCEALRRFLTRSLTCR